MTHDPPEVACGCESVVVTVDEFEALPDVVVLSVAALLLLSVVPLVVLVEVSVVGVEVADAVCSWFSWASYPAMPATPPTPTTTMPTVACTSRRAPIARTLPGRGVEAMPLLCHTGLNTQ
jgi:hypothetical protein